MGLSQDWSGKLVGEYHLRRRLGGGSFGEVYQAEDVREHSLVAIKLIKASLTQGEDLKAFLNEARSMRLRHPHIVPLLDFGLSDQDQPFLVMEYVAGGTLRDRYLKGNRVPLDMVVDLTSQLASALQYAHDRHVIHRDVKPENMLCRTDGTVLLSDFGIASVAHASSSASAYQSFGGTLPYMAPEQLEGHPRPASDQYALAVVVYEWLAGARPFQGTMPELVSQHLHALPPSLLDQVSTLPAEVEQVVFKALSKQPQERFAHVDDFAVAFQVAGQSRDVSASQVSFSPLRTAPCEGKPSGSDQGIKPDEARGSITSSAASPTSSELKTRADPPAPGEIPPTISSSASLITSGAGSSSDVLLTAVTVPHSIRHRRIFTWHLLFTFGLMLLVALSGSGLLYLGFAVQRARTLSPSQVVSATATTAVQAYATGTARQGVMLGFNAAHTGYNPYEHTLSPGNVSRLTALWSFTTGGEIYSSPVVASGMVYVGSRDDSTFHGVFYAFDAGCRKSCQPLWSFPVTVGNSFSSPAIAGGMVYVGTDRTFYAFDASCRKSCQPLWSFPVTVGESPVVVDNVVYVVGSTDTLYAFAVTCRSACQPLWSFTTGNAIDSSPAVADGMIYIGSSGKLYTFDTRCRQACQPVWSFATGGNYLFTPVVAADMVYIVSADSGTFDSKLYAFDATCHSDCQPLWSFAPGGGIESSPATADGMVYVGGSGAFYAFDARCRKVCQPLWSFPAGDTFTSEPTIAGNVVYIGSHNGEIYAFNTSCRKNCRSLWTSNVGLTFANATKTQVYESRIAVAPAVANGMVYVSSLNHKFCAFGLAS